MMTPQDKTSPGSFNPQEPDADGSHSMPRLNKIGEGRLSIGQSSNAASQSAAAAHAAEGKSEKVSRERIHP